MAEHQPPVDFELNRELVVQGPKDGTALCLSGGGYRAMMFHVGALIRLNEASLLPDLSRVSSVSGGSITAAVLGLHWSELQFEKGVARNLNVVVSKLRAMASQTIDEGAILGGVFSEETITERLTQSYKEHLFGEATLQDLPADAKGPRFVINATNIQTGSLARFSRPYLADYRIGVYPTPRIPLALAVAASSAFPPFLSPVEIKLDGSRWQKEDSADLCHSPFTTNLVLSDGGVYDNLGLETAWKNYKTVLVSDGGGKLGAEETPSRDWIRHSKRVLDVIDHQVRSLRYRQLIDSYKAAPTQSNHRCGAYWGIRTDIAHYKLPNALPCPHNDTMILANTPTRFKAMDAILQEQLVNWGYGVCDAALRTYYDAEKSLNVPTQFPYPGSGIPRSGS